MKNFLLIVAVSILCLQMPGYVYCDSLSLDTSNWKLVRGLAQDAGVGHQLKYQINVPVGPSLANRQQAVIDRSQTKPRDHEQGQLQQAGQISHEIVVADRHQQSASTFDTRSLFVQA